MSELAAQYSDFGYWGVIKETGVDDEGLSEFYNDYFTFPLYRDINLATYAAFGNKSILTGMSWNPLKLYRGYKELTKRLKDKKLDGNMKGEGLTKGGVFILNTDGEVVHAIEESTGDPLDIDEIQAVMDEMRQKGSEKIASEL